MARKLLGGFPAGLDLDQGYTLRFLGVDPTTGDEVAGVVVSNVSLLVDNVKGGDLESGFGDIEPLFTPIPAGGA
jgi:hypothetical protein